MQQSQKPIELVVFDMAGTTVYDGDSVARCFQAAMAAAGVHVDRQQANAVMGIPKPEAIRRLVAASPLASELLLSVDAIHDDFIARMKDFYRRDPGVREVQGSGRVFARLQSAGIRVALNTGFGREIADVLLQRLGWNQPSAAVDATICSDEVARGRPHADMIRQLMQQLSVRSAERVAKVGDTPADLEEGAAAGCGLIIGVTGGSHTAEELRPYPHTHLIASVTDMLPLVLS
jgi:phosphonatase-like hydrolase